MTKEEILKKVIKRSTENGFETYPSLGKNAWVGPNLMNGSLMEEINWQDAMENLNNIIFSHEFAKAFWSEEPDIHSEFWCSEKNISFEGYIKLWQYHLQQMVLEEEPLDYLKKFIK